MRTFREEEEKKRKFQNLFFYLCIQPVNMSLGCCTGILKPLGPQLRPLESPTPRPILVLCFCAPVLVSGSSICPHGLSQELLFSFIPPSSDNSSLWISKISVLLPVPPWTINSHLSLLMTPNLLPLPVTLFFQLIFTLCAC